MKIIARFLVIVSILCINFQAFADWQVKTEIDAMTDEVKHTAIVKNAAGHSFSVYRSSEDKSVWGNFSLSGKSFFQIDKDKPPMYRIDKNKPIELFENVELELLAKKHGVHFHTYNWDPKWVSFLIWHGKSDTGISYKLTQLIEGEKIVFRYFLAEGGYKDTSFTLWGASFAISQAIGL